MKAYRNVEVKLHEFLMPIIGECDWSDLLRTTSDCVYQLCFRVYKSQDYMAAKSDEVFPGDQSRGWNTIDTS
jgi:hypothetical protein